MRLRKRISFEFNVNRSVFCPLISAIIAVMAAKYVFVFTGSSATWLWLTMQILFAFCVCSAFILLTDILSKREKC